MACVVEIKTDCDTPRTTAWLNFPREFEEISLCRFAFPINFKGTSPRLFQLEQSLMNSPSRDSERWSFCTDDRLTWDVGWIEDYRWFSLLYPYLCPVLAGIPTVSARTLLVPLCYHITDLYINKEGGFSRLLADSDCDTTPNGRAVRWWRYSYFYLVMLWTCLVHHDFWLQHLFSPYTNICIQSRSVPIMFIWLVFRVYYYRCTCTLIFSN